MSIDNRNEIYTLLLCSNIPLSLSLDEKRSLNLLSLQKKQQQFNVRNSERKKNTIVNLIRTCFKSQI